MPFSCPHDVPNIASVLPRHGIRQIGFKDYFLVANDPARTSSKPAASLRNYKLGKPTPRRRWAGNAPIAVPTFRSFRDEERGRRVPNQCSHGGQVMLVFGVDQLLVHSLDFVLVVRLGDQSPRWRKSKNDHHPEELQRWVLFHFGSSRHRYFPSHSRMGITR